jgi:uncharacterized protein (TIGR02271 family)
MKNKDEQEELSFNVMEEQARVHKEVVEQAKVRIVKKVHEEEQNIDLSSRQEEVEIHKVVVNKYVDVAPQVRYDGDTMIVPVMKEVVTVEKRLLLAEEIHITKRTVKTNDEQTIPLLREEVHVERVTKNEIKENL